MTASRRLAPAHESDLDRLARVANTEHDAYEATQSAAVAHAIAAGEALIEAKAQLQHGHGLPWLRESVEFPARTAQEYMQIARNTRRVAHLGSVRSALAELAEPKPEPSVTDSLERLHENARKLTAHLLARRTVRLRTSRT